MFTIVTNYTKMLGHVYLNLSYDLIAILNTNECNGSDFCLQSIIFCCVSQQLSICGWQLSGFYWYIKHLLYHSIEKFWPYKNLIILQSLGKENN